MTYFETAKMMKQAWGRVRLHTDWEEPVKGDYADSAIVLSPYPSVYCLPHVRELLKTLLGTVPLAFVLKNTRASLSHISSQSLKLIEDLDTVERFYDMFREEQWIFHDRLHVSKVKPIIDEVQAGAISVMEASDKIADIYDEDMINICITRLKSIESLVPDKESGPFCDRTLLLWDARDMYLSENYRGCIHLLLACADGAVNDFYLPGEEKHGLWQRDTGTMVAYDSFVGHKYGLLEILATAKQGVSELPVVSEKERYDAMMSGQISAGNMLGGMFPERHLRRHGIAHGMLVNYGSKLLAAKAWNLVFAIGDWMYAVHKARLPDPPPKSCKESLQDMMDSIKSNEEYKKQIQSHVKQELTPKDEGFSEHPLAKRAEGFLASWEGSGNGVQCQKMWQFGTEKTMPFWWNRGDDRIIKDHFAMHKIHTFRIDLLDHHSYQFADVHITCRFDGYLRSKKVEKDIKMTLKWELTDEEDNLPFQSDNPEWYLRTWDPWLGAES